MTSERYQRVVEIFQAAADRGPDARPAFLAEACAGDDELRREVEAMLDADAQSGGFLDKPANDLAAAVVAARETRSLIGHRVSHYEVVSLLGAGGMGEVYRAKDTRLRREVAIKVAVASFDDRFEREARTVAALNHPNICTLHDIGPNYLVMELVEGPTLSDRIKQGPILLDEALDIARQIADALQAAHEKGIIHRDLKPANVKVTPQGRVKVLDFGLAKAIRSVEADQNLSQSGSVSGVQTLAGNIVGTPGYMSPEQAQGKALDSRSDIFSFGAVLYEMITGRRAFQGQSSASILAAVLREDPRPLCELAKNLPPDLDRIVTRCLRKDPEARYPSMTAVVQDLESCRSCLAATSSGAINFKLLAQESRQPRVFIPALLIVLAVVGGSAWLLQRNAKARWARTQALPEITNLIDHEKFTAAYALEEKAAKYIPNDPILAGLRPLMSRPVTIETMPAGADVYRRDYGASDGPWEYAGRSPLQNLRVPRGLFQWKIVKKGYTTSEGSLFPNPFGRTQLASITLDEDGKAPSGMVRVSHGTVPVPLEIAGFQDLAPVPLEDFWIDKYEVTNEQFKEFVDQGGYQKQDYWKQEFRKSGRVLSWAEAIKLFRDATGRPGPAGWVQGDFAAGQADYPVSGISWYEAAAYAEFAGKALPTIWHWSKAAGYYSSDFVVPASNFSGKGPARVGSHKGLGPWGTYDMAGNVKEWCWNEAGRGERYIMGGGWDEPAYQFNTCDVRSAFERSANFGFRCVRYAFASMPPKASTEPIPSRRRDYKQEKPVSDAVFRAYKSVYSYDKTPLNATVEAIDDSNESWKREKITFAAAYGNERVIAYLFLPKNFKPPLQTVVFFPGSGAIHLHSSANLNLVGVGIGPFDFVIKSGRAVLIPIFKGTFERGDELASDDPTPTSSYRDHVIAWAKDLGRSIDYIETRPEIDRNKFAFYGVSWGAAMGGIMAAVEPRFKVCVLMVGGFYMQKALPEVDQINFVPHVKIPTLMLNGRYDFFFPTETAQAPLYHLLGTPQEQKRYMVYDTGHNIPRIELIKETVDWLDRYLGPMKKAETNR